MSTFPLRIGTPDVLLFEGDVWTVWSEEVSAVILRFLQDTVTFVLLLEWGKPV